MNIEQARKIIGVYEEDDPKTVKRKFRKLIGCYHPDAVGSDSPEHIKRAQEINEAYHFLKKWMLAAIPQKEVAVWQGEVNDKAFCERNIYQYYSMDIWDVSEEMLYYQVARGRYMWDPDEEEFELFLTSIHQVSHSLLETVEEQYGSTRVDEYGFAEKRFAYQARIFECLAMQYIHPANTLKKLTEPQKSDSKGREIYQFGAFLGEKGNGQTFQTMAALEEKDILFPEAFQGNKIRVMDRHKCSLGFLSLEDDQLYFCIIPLLKARLAQIKLVINKVAVDKKHRPYSVKVNVDCYVRLEQDADAYECSNQNLIIADILAEYGRELQR